jgi:hypothetical protein
MGKALGLLLIISSLIIFGQQCSRVQLEHFEEIYLASESSNPFRINPPTEFPIVRRYVLLVDMSNSMISGPCQNDVDAGILFTETPVYSPYAPTKGIGNINDHRADGIDCMVNELLPISRNSMAMTFPNILTNPPRFYEAHPGIDFSAHRIEIVRRWLIDLLNKSNPEMITNTKVMIIPVSGGVSQRKLPDGMSAAIGGKSAFQFFQINDPQVSLIVNWLKSEHLKNFDLVKSADVFRYDLTTMGTTSPGGILNSVYDSLVQDMKILNSEGLLSYADYDFVHLTDGVITPKAMLLVKF